MARPITDQGLQDAKRLMAELTAGHPDYHGQAYESLLPWQQQQITYWTLNLEGAVSRFVPGLIARLEAAEAALKVVD